MTCTDGVFRHAQALHPPKTRFWHCQKIMFLGVPLGTVGTAGG